MVEGTVNWYRSWLIGCVVGEDWFNPLDRGVGVGTCGAADGVGVGVWVTTEDEVSFPPRSEPKEPVPVCCVVGCAVGEANGVVLDKTAKVGAGVADGVELGDGNAGVEVVTADVAGLMSG